jgi:hypothetical protein
MDFDPRDDDSRDVHLPRGLEREIVRYRDREYTLRGSESSSGLQSRPAGRERSRARSTLGRSAPSPRAGPGGHNSRARISRACGCVDEGRARRPGEPP